MPAHTPYLAHQMLRDWIAQHHEVDPTRLKELAIGRGGLAEGPFETLTGEPITPVQMLARFWETLDDSRAGSMAHWLLDSYPDTQTDPASLGELLAGASRPMFGNSVDETKRAEEEQRKGLDTVVTRCENLLEALPLEQQKVAHQAMIRSTHRSLEHSMKAGRYQAARRWIQVISNWFSGTVPGLGPEMPGYFSWEDEKGSPFSKEAARLLHVVFQAIDDDQVLGVTFTMMFDTNLLSPAKDLAPHGIEALKEAREDLARHMLGGLQPLSTPVPCPTVEGFRALVGLNAVMVLMESADPQQQRDYLAAFEDLWPVFEERVRQLPVYQTNGLGLRNGPAQKLFSQFIPRAEHVLNVRRGLALDQGLPEAKPSAFKPRF